jgi:hypothetical protein
MSLSTELSDHAFREIRSDPAGRAFLDGGTAALAAAGFPVSDLLRVLNLILTVHREHIMRLADEIDALKRAS